MRLYITWRVGLGSDHVCTCIQCMYRVTFADLQIVQKKCVHFENELFRYSF